MNLKLVKLQALACVVISLFLFAELGYGEFTERRLEKTLHFTEISDEAPVALPTLAEQQPGLEAYAEMVERPLFIQGRKPIAEADPAAKVQSVETGQIEDWLLIGVYNKGKTQMALFSKKNEAKKYQKLSAGQTISGWTLKEIQADQVVLEQAGQQKIVLLRKPRPQVPGKFPPARAKPAPPPAAPAQPNNNQPENGNDDSETN